MPRSLSLLLLAGLAVGCAAHHAPVPVPAAEPAAPALGSEPVVGEIEPGERHHYRLDAGSRRWVTIELYQREVALDLILVDQAGTTIDAVPARTNWSTAVVDLVTGDDGPFEVQVTAPHDASRSGGYVLRVVEERAARDDDDARMAARRQLRNIEQPPPDAPPLSSEEEEAFLRGLLASREIVWSGEEMAWIYEHLGALASLQKRPAEAEAFFRAGLGHLGETGRRSIVAYLRIRLAKVLHDQGLLAEAREEYRSAVEAALASGDSSVLGHAANLEAGFLYRQGEVEAATRTLQEVVSHLEPPDRFSTHVNLALFLHGAGELESARVHHRAAERLLEGSAVDSVQARFGLLRTAGVLDRTAGESGKALQAFDDALRLAVDAGQVEWEASIRVHLGTLLVQLGEYGDARRYLEPAALSANADLRARALLSLGWVELAEGDTAAAATLLGQAIATPGLAQDLESSLRYALAVAKTRLGEFDEAHRLLTALMERAEAKGLQFAAAEAHAALGALHLARGAHDEAARSLERALELAQATGDTLREAATRSRLAELEVERERPAAALPHVLEALRLQEAVRSRLVEPGLRSSFLARWRGDYDRAIEISLRLAAADPGAGHDRRAFALSEAAHARTLTELLAEASVEMRRDISPELLAAEHEAERRLAQVQNALTERLHRATTEAQVEGLRQQREHARRALEEVEREIRRLHSEYADIRYPEPPGVDQVQGWLAPGTALLEYALGERTSALFVVTRDELIALPLPPAAEIAARVADVRRLLSEQNPLHRPQLTAMLAELTRILIVPAAHRLANIERLLVVPDGDLFYLPFETLGDPLAPQHGPAGLLRRWTVTYLPSAAVLPHLEREAPAAWQRDVMAFADPPPRPVPPAGVLRGAGLPPVLPGDSLPALPWARIEAERITELFPADRVELYIGEAARESLLKAPPASARRLHIASHGVISTTDAEESYVLLAPDESDDGLLYLREVFDLDLEAELVVLSGCETGLGPRLAGEGLLGLARGFLYAGARDLVVSLWPVSDAGTEKLMVDFYRRLEDGRAPAEALREAKLARIDGGETNPFLWAPFVVFGAPPGNGRLVTSRAASSP